MQFAGTKTATGQLGNNRWARDDEGTLTQGQAIKVGCIPAQMHPQGRLGHHVH